jgi:stage II sporulation protein AA (anti-sigma F factor antagonist)
MAVVTLPAQIDGTNAGRIGEELHSACVSGASVIVADMTATRLCDSGGFRVLACAQKQAAAYCAELWLAVPSPALRHAFALRGVFAPTFDSLGAALSLGPSAGRVTGIIG